MSNFISSIYFGWVSHHRLRPIRHNLFYRVFMLYLDLDELPLLDQGGILFGVNRPALFSYYDRDHGSRDGSPLRTWVNKVLQDANLTFEDPQVRIFAFPRVLGYSFNPLSLIFCYDKDQKLRVVIYEVKNTFGEQHSYLFSVPLVHGKILTHQTSKKFYVSPFMAMSGEYRFRLLPPDKQFNLYIRQVIEEGDQLLATWSAQQFTWNNKRLISCLWRYPLLTLKIITAIHWHGLRIFIKGARYYSRPPLPEKDITNHHEI